MLYGGEEPFYRIFLPHLSSLSFQKKAQNQITLVVVENYKGGHAGLFRIIFRRQ